MRIRINMLSVLVGMATVLAIPAINAQQQGPSTTDAKLLNLLTAKRDALQQRFEYIKRE